MDKPIISLQHVGKTFRIYKSNRQRFAGEILGRESGDSQVVLEDICLDILPGEKIALIGAVGSGRSTLINLIAGVTYPTAGTIKVRKKTTMIRNLRVGFMMDRSGRENIKIQGSLLGWTGEQIKEKEEEIIEFAELGDIIDYPLDTYTMIDANRLGLAIQTTFGSDIILFDAPFTKGDMAFRNKSIRRLHELSDDKTLILVTNEIRLAAEFCQRGILLDKGRITSEGPVEEVHKLYKKTKKKKKAHMQMDTMGNSQFEGYGAGYDNDEEFG